MIRLTVCEHDNTVAFWDDIQEIYDEFEFRNSKMLNAYLDDMRESGFELHIVFIDENGKYIKSKSEYYE